MTGHHAARAQMWMNTNDYELAQIEATLEVAEQLRVSNLLQWYKFADGFANKSMEVDIKVALEIPIEEEEPVASEKRPDNRHPECIKQWPECLDGTYDPKCCRFPKSCSCES